MPATADPEAILHRACKVRFTVSSPFGASRRVALTEIAVFPETVQLFVPMIE